MQDNEYQDRMAHVDAIDNDKLPELNDLEFMIYTANLCFWDEAYDN